MRSISKSICVPCPSSSRLDQAEFPEAVVPVLPGWERQPWDLCIVTRRNREAQFDALHEFALWWVEREGKDALKRVEAGQAVQQLLNAAPQ